MSDIFSNEKRSEIMSQIKGRNTKPEIIVRKLLHGMGFRFRLHDKNLPGKPDIVLPRHKRVVFVHGCFWHGHVNCKRSKLPSSNFEFWQKKIAANIERDSRNIQSLKALGWEFLIVWSCQTASNKALLSETLKGFMKHGSSSEAK